jgi:hypothetical protein
MKSSLKIFLVFLGFEFVLIQTLVFLDLITVHWDTMGKRAFGNSGEKVDKAKNWGLAFLTTNLPFKGTFSGIFCVIHDPS